MCIPDIVSAGKITYDTIDDLKDGQCYGDTAHFAVIGSNPTRYYELISEKDFLSKLTKGFFLYQWSSSVKTSTKYFSIDMNSYQMNGKDSQTVKAIEAAGLSVFSSCAKPDDSEILKLFSAEQINYGYLLGVVDRNCTRVYDMTSRVEEYQKKGSRVDWDGVYYITTSGDVTGASRVQLENLGIQAFYEDLMSAQTYIEAKEQEVKDTTPVIQPTESTNYTETASFTNIVITTYYTNITVIVDPYFQNLNSILKFRYPKFATEGDWTIYTLERMGVTIEPLTVHLITNGHWCANVRWEANESGVKNVRIRLPISEEFDDNAPFEVLVKTLNRRVESEL